MKTGMTLLAMSCALALAACGNDTDRPAETDPPATTTMPADTTPADTTPIGTPPADTMPADPAPVDGALPGEPMPADSTAPEIITDDDDRAEDATGEANAAADTEGAATVANCSTTIEGNDRMQYNVDSIHIPADCSDFTITLEHTGSLPVAAMGHNVVVTSAADYAGASADGLAAGAASDYVQAGDDRVIAATDMIGGGESTSVTFSTGALEAGDEYTFFCSFPGHAALMRGDLTFGG